MSEHLTVTTEGHVATIVYARGPANFVSADTVGEIADAFEALDADDNVRALVFATEGKVFCGGADLTGAVLDGADLSSAVLDGARWTDGKRICGAGSRGRCQ